jgi:thiol peroxidase
LTTLRERLGDAFELDEQLTVVGDRLEPDDTAPAFALDSFDAGTQSITTVTLAGSAGTVRLLNVINSLDTPVCSIETRRWDRLRDDLPENVTLYTVSMDLPFAQSRWIGSEGTTHKALSAHKSEAFGIDYGVLLKEWRLLQRAVFVIDTEDRVVYVEYVQDQMREPDYESAVEAVRAATLRIRPHDA